MSEAPFETLSAVAGAGDSALWRRVREVTTVGVQPPPAILDSAILESEVSPIEVLDTAPPRTAHVPQVMRSSPMPSSLRAMVERRGFGRRFDAVRIRLDELEHDLPGMDCPEEDLVFPASAGSFEELALSVDCLLQHRKQLMSRLVDRSRARRDVLVLGAGPGGLIAAIELRLRDHRVVVCEQRRAYTRNRFMGVYKEVAHRMAALGMPESMTYDFTHYRGKRGIMVADIQTFLHAVALKLGVVVYTGAVVRSMTREALREGRLELQRSAGSDAGTAVPAEAGVVRWHYDTVMRVRSGVGIRFDTVLEATGGRSGARELLVGADNVVSLRTLATETALRDPSLDSHFDDPLDHCIQIVESDYGCPPHVRRQFAAALVASDGAVPDEVPSLVSNVDASIIIRELDEVARPAGMGARIGEQELDIPRDWVIVRCPRSDRTLTRYQIEGPLPQSFQFGGRRIRTEETLPKLNPVSLLVRILYAIGVPFDAVDRRRLVDFYTLENAQGNASDVVATFVGTFRGLRLGGADPIWCGRVPGSDTVEYGIVGEALQNAWYRFGVGIDDTFAGAIRFARMFDLPPDERRADALRFEATMTSRSVQVCYHLWRVAENADQGVVGPVLTECHMERRYHADLADADLKREAHRTAEIAAVLGDLDCDGVDALLTAALEHRLDVCCGRVLELLRRLDCDPALLARAIDPMRMGLPDWRAHAVELLQPALSATQRELLAPLGGTVGAHHPPLRSEVRHDRLRDVALGHYAWATPWVRACALRALDPGSADDLVALRRAAAEPDRCVADAAAEVLGPTGAGVPGGNEGRTIPAKVEILKEVSLFRSMPHEELVGLATLLHERRVLAGEQIVGKGETGDSLYVVASGRVRVHDGGRTLAQLAHNDFFGELSLLDTEPRAATVTALTSASLLRLEQADFYALLAESPHILRSVNRVLCGMVRANLAPTVADGAADAAAPLPPHA
jgi:Cyclic nucleotide-binding domain